MLGLASSEGLGRTARNFRLEQALACSCAAAKALDAAWHVASALGRHWINVGLFDLG